MQNHRYAFVLTALLVVFLLAACFPVTPAAVPTNTPTPIQPTATVTPASTPDPCTPENIVAEIRTLNRPMREFDDAAALSANTPREQLKPIIAELQRIRRDAEDQTIPACLAPLKELQVTQMNTFIQTLLAFIGGADQELVNQGIGLSNQLHDQYTVEMARLQGVVIPPTTTPLPTIGTPPVGTPGTEVPTPTVSIVSNMGSGGINLRLTPTLDGQTIGMLAVGQSALALGQTENSAWIKVEIPGRTGQTAWVYASLVQLSGPTPLPFIKPE